MTYLREMADGTKIEYRRFPWHSTILHLEHRVLRPDGTPYDETWFPVTDSHLLSLQQQGSDIVEILAQEGELC
jgi:hypothetical protein